MDDDFTARTLERMKTKLYPPSQAPYLTYTRVPWKIHIRKEVITTMVAETYVVILFFTSVFLNLFN
jgi:hypothetical protein